ncbi:hypothetical protein KY308_03915 [Candidatus Woesearchaeota archaeon]|nr:hypothetical protein [Candidatus Woesearchaeota archaeon]
MKKVEKLLKDKKTKEQFMVDTRTVIPLDTYRFVKLKINYKEGNKDKFLFIVLEKNKFKKAMLDNCREYRFYDIKKDGWVHEHILKKRFLRKCPSGCKDAEFKVIEKPNAVLKNKKDSSSWVFKDVWQCTKCNKKWLVTCEPDKGDSFEEAKFLKKEKGKRVYKTKKGKASFGRSPSRV